MAEPDLGVLARCAGGVVANVAVRAAAATGGETLAGVGAGGVLSTFTFVVAEYAEALGPGRDHSWPSERGRLCWTNLGIAF